MISKSFLPSITEKLSHEKFNLHVSHDAKWLDIAEFEGEVPCYFTLVARLNFSCDSFSIMDSGKNDFEVTIKEALHIKFKKPTINRQLISQGSSFILNVF